jgi:ribosome maturation factor RimP
VKDSHYARYSGKWVEIKLYQAVEHQKKFQGELIGLEQGDVVINMENSQKRFPRETLAYCRLVYTEG